MIDINPQGQKKTKLRILYIAIIVILALGAPTVGFLIYQNSVNKANNENLGSGLSYPEGWVEINLSEEDQKNGNILKAGRNNPFSSLLVRTIDGELSKDVSVKKLPDQLAEGFKKKLPDFVLVKKAVAKLGEYNTAQITYKQSNDGKTLKNFIIVIPTAKKVFYITFSTEEKDFKAVSGDFEQISHILVDFIAKHV